MPIPVTCPNPGCGRPARIPDDLTGRPVRCKACGQTFVAGSTATDAGQRPTMSACHTPQQIGRFRVQEKLGVGAFGTVYRAYDPQLDREVALKVPNPGVLNSRSRVERFLREAKASAGLRHPNIVPVYDAGKDGETYYIASAFIKGQSLADEIPEGGMPFARAARLVFELAGAVGYAHEQGVVHRDIKPANVMADPAGRPHLMDFGLASRADDAEKLTHDGTVMGTPAYMAPEQAAGKSGEAGPPADQYALGVVLYELLTGTVPFAGPVPVVLHNVINTEPDSPRRARPELPKDLETICLKAISKRPADRYADCKALAEDLRRWLAGEPIAARRLAVTERAWRWVKRNRVIAALTLAAAFLLVVGTITSTTFAIRAVRAARDAVAARDAERAASAALAAETKKAREMQLRAEINLASAKASEAEAKTAVAEARAAETRATTAADVATKARQEAEMALVAQKKAEGQANATSQQLKELKIGPDDQLYRDAMREAARHLSAGRYSQARTELAKCPAIVRGPEWAMLSQWAKDAKVPGRDIALTWGPRKDFLYRDSPVVFLSQDLTRAALLFTSATGVRRPGFLIRVFDIRAEPLHIASATLTAESFPRQDRNAEISSRLTFDNIAFASDNRSIVASWSLEIETQTRIFSTSYYSSLHAFDGSPAQFHSLNSPRDGLVSRNKDGRFGILHRSSRDDRYITEYVMVNLTPSDIKLSFLEDRIVNRQSTCFSPDGSLFAFASGQSSLREDVFRRHNPRDNEVGEFGTGSLDDITVFDSKLAAEHVPIQNGGSALVGLGADVLRKLAGEHVPIQNDRGKPIAFAASNNRLLTWRAETKEATIYSASIAGGNKTWRRESTIKLSGGAPIVGISPTGDRILTHTTKSTNHEYHFYDARDGFLVCDVVSLAMKQNLAVARGALNLGFVRPTPDWRRWVGIYQHTNKNPLPDVGGATHLRVWDVAIPMN